MTTVQKQENPKGRKENPFFGNRRKSVKTICATVLGLLAAAGGGLLFAANSGVTAASATGDGQAVYRTYTVQQGDLTVGLSENGTVILDREYITMPVSAVIESVYVKTGEKVEEGDSLLAVDVDALNKGTAAYENQVSSALLSLNKAIAEQKEKLDAAKRSYESAVTGGGMAGTEQELALMQLDASLENARAALSDYEEELAEYQAMQETFPSDSAELERLSAELEIALNVKNEADEALQEFKDDNAELVSDYNAAVSAEEKAKDAYHSAQDSKAFNDVYGSSGGNSGGGSSNSNAGTDTATALYSSDELSIIKAKQEWNDAKFDLALLEPNYESYAERLETLEDTLESATDTYEELQETYDDFKESYSETYGNETQTSIARQIVALQRNIVSAQQKLTELEETYDASVLEIQRQTGSALSAASLAGEQYNNTVNELSLNVKEQQDNYNDLLDQLEELQEQLSEDGVITAPVSGAVMSVAVSEGDDIPANQTMVTLADHSAISLTMAVSEEDVVNVWVGMDAEVTLTAYEGLTFTGKVDAVSTEPSRSGSASVSYAVTVILDENPAITTILEGMTGEITLIQKRVEDTLYITQQALVVENGKTYVRVREADGSNTLKEIVTGFTDGRYVEVLSGLSAGDIILAESAVRMQ